MNLNKYDQAVELWCSYNINTVSDLDKYLDNFRILFAYHSGKIENNEITLHDTREIFENGKVLNYTGSPRTLFEQQNQKLCFEALKEKILRKDVIDIELVKEVHQILTSGTYDERRYMGNDERSGEFKKHDYITGMHEVGSPVDVYDKLKTVQKQAKK
jgi:Fic family protein